MNEKNQEGGYLVPEFLDKRVERLGAEAAEWREVIAEGNGLEHDLEELVLRLVTFNRRLEPLGYDIVRVRVLDELLGRRK